LLVLQIERITAMASKYIGRHVQAGVGALSASSPSASASGLVDSLPAAALPSLGCSSELTSASMASDLAASTARTLPLSDVEKPLVVELAIASMEEFLHVAQAGDPLWSMDPSNPSAAEIIDQHVYLQKFQRGIAPSPPGVNPETSRHTGLVIMNSSSLVETFMDVVSTLI
jgi:homeobox-leucine zipper protein